jgi:hypothetical protein
MPEKSAMTREVWLTNALNMIRPDFEEAGDPLPDGDSIRVSCSWPHKGGTRKKGRVEGQIWYPKATKDSRYHICVSPMEAKSDDVVSILYHEGMHAAVHMATGHTKHGAPFRALGNKLGMDGKPAHMEAGEPLRDWIKEKLVEKIGEYPHGEIDPKEVPKQTTRMLKLVCHGVKEPHDVYTVRASKKVTEMGMPSCPCGEEMYVEEKEN